jgi:hypothetical protein
MCTREEYVSCPVLSPGIKIDHPKKKRSAFHVPGLFTDRTGHSSRVVFGNKKEPSKTKKNSINTGRLFTSYFSLRSPHRDQSTI